LDGEKGVADTATKIHELSSADVPAPAAGSSRVSFSGFTPLSGWGVQEGPVPEAFLPPFHWGFAPVTQLAIESPAGQPASLVADVLTYTENQSCTIELNGLAVGQHLFERTNHKERMIVPLALRSGRNEVTLRYSHSLVTDYDPRKLAVIFLTLRILGGQSS
jgi:hypothetical protein